MSFTRNLQNYLKQNNNTRFEDTLCSGTEWSNAIEDYQFLEQIGSGSFGQVFQAKIDGRQCAVKRICKLQSPNINKILSEVSIHIRLYHEHILQLFNVLEDRKNVYLVMEVCHGGSLSQLISREVAQRKALSSSPSGSSKSQSTITNPCPPKPVLPYAVIGAILRQTLSALAYLHRNSIIHRDLNLNNILLVSPFSIPPNESLQAANLIRIKLCDFGLAIDLSRSSRQVKVNAIQQMNETTNDAMGNTICGTPGFISPEIWTQQVVASHKSDIYSLGSIVFACIAGYTPNGDIELTNFHPMTADLITQLLESKPDNRPELDSILEHIFLSGRIDSFRVHPIEKTTKNVHMSIDSSGNVDLCFLKDNLTLSATPDGSRIFITSPDGLHRKEYSFYELPQNYWKRYSYLIRFISLVKGKTSKITVHCGKWFKENNHSGTLKDLYISRCALMENGDFEVTLHNLVLKQDFKHLLNEHLPKNLERYRSKLEDLQERLLQVEREFTELSYELKNDLFPIVFGLSDKVHEISSKPANTKPKETEAPIVTTNSQVLRSMQINGIGLATQFSNGSIKVHFNDGSDLCLDNESQIFYVERNILKRFNKNDILPEVVLNKIARMPQVINHLRQCADSVTETQTS